MKGTFFQYLNKLAKIARIWNQCGDDRLVGALHIHDLTRAKVI